jgi:hypothetical protein
MTAARIRSKRSDRLFGFRPAHVPASVALVAGAFFIAVASSANAQNFSFRTDRPGSDYKVFWTENDNGDICQRVCWGDKKCKAWTWVRPGVQGSGARCWLKAARPPAKHSYCCNSGLAN